MFAGLNAFAAGLNSDHVDALIFEEREKHPHGIRTTPYAGDQDVRQPLLLFEDLPPSFIPNDALKISYHQRIGVGSIYGPQNVVRAADIEIGRASCRERGW